DILKRRAGRAKLFNYRLKPWTRGDQLPTRAKFDGVLVDAPCSGVGTWGRNPHARWTASPSDITELAAMQRDLLARVSESVKPGGKLVYSVCTLTRAETEEVASEFDATRPNFQKLNLIVPGRSDVRGARVTLRPEEW